ncbi:MAG: Peptidase M11, gametolysin, partial [Parcubacteria group bacterium Greene0416_14]
NALALIIAGTGKRVARAYNFSAAKAPLLHVEYTTAPSVLPTAPSSSDISVLTNYLLKLNSVYTNPLTSAPMQSDALSLMVSTAGTRKTEILKALQRGNTIAKVYFSMIPANLRSAFPAAVQPYLEKETSVRGVLNVLHADDFERRIATYDYFLTSGGTQSIVHLLGSRPELVSGLEITLHGYVLDQYVVASGAKRDIQIVSAPPPSPPINVQKTLVVLINYTDAMERPFTPQQIDDHLAGAFQNLYREMSYGRISWDFDVIGWYSIPRPSRNSDGFCERVRSYPAYPEESPYPNRADEVYKLFKGSVDITQYDHILFLDSSSCGGGDSFGKISYVLGGATHTLGMARAGHMQEFNLVSPHGHGLMSGDILVAHELGHNLGTLHANGWECGTGSSFGGDCTSIEYGSPFDIMGNARYSMHFNAATKDGFSWGTERMLQITSSGVYTINYLEAPTGVPFARIKNSALDEKIYLEYRRPYGFDSRIGRTDDFLSPSELENQHGMLVYWLPRSPNASPLLQPFLLDMTPTSPDWWISLPIDYEHTVLLGGKPGDINYDDAVTPGDAQLVEAYRTGTGTTALTDFQQKKADVNQDGVVTVTDTQCIFDNSLGKPSCLDQSTQVQSWPVFRSEDFGMQLGPVLNVASSSITFSVNLFAPQCVRRVPRVAPFAGDYFAGGQISISFFI